MSCDNLIDSFLVFLISVGNEIMWINMNIFMKSCDAFRTVLFHNPSTCFWRYVILRYYVKTKKKVGATIVLLLNTLCKQTSLVWLRHSLYRRGPIPGWSRPWHRNVPWALWVPGLLYLYHVRKRRSLALESLIVAAVILSVKENII